MIKNSDLFYLKAKEYQDKRNQLERDYSASMEGLKSYEGSMYYQEQSEMLRANYENNLDAIRIESTRGINVILDSMRNTAGKTPAKAPTTEQLNILNVLKLRTNVTKSDLDSAAGALRNCPLALSALNDIALNNGFMGYSRMIGGMNAEEAARICKDNGVIDFLKYNTSRAARAAAGQRFKNMTLKKRKTFNDKESCFRELFGIDGEDFSKFCDIVDGETAENEE